METIRYDFSNIFADSIGDEAGLAPSDIESYQEKARVTFNKLQEARKRGEVGFYELPEDSKIVNKVIEEAKRVASKYENLLVLGIGGSALGMKCLAAALLPPHYNLLHTRGRRGSPRLFIADNIDPDTFEPLLDILDWKQTCVNVISKSGRTTETAAQFALVREILIKKYGREKWGDHVYITTDPNTGPLRRLANEEKIRNFAIPVSVGGRFSVFSAVGLFPAAATGIDIGILLEGAAKIRDMCDNFTIENPVYKNALVHLIFDEVKNARISVMMPYSERLEKFGNWYAQLLAESLGKEGKGWTPMKSVGATDQHSQLQLYMDGPRDKLITIIGIENFQRGSRLPERISEPFEYISGCTLAEILKAEEKATSLALKEARRPHVVVTLAKLDEYHMGALLMAYEIQIAYMGMLYGINPFNQPGVELGKKLAKEILAKR